MDILKRSSYQNREVGSQDEGAAAAEETKPEGNLLTIS